MFSQLNVKATTVSKKRFLNSPTDSLVVKADRLLSLVQTTALFYV